MSCGYFIPLQDDNERRLLKLCYEGTADISQFRELLRQGADVNIYDEVGIQIQREGGEGEKWERKKINKSHYDQ